MNNGYRKQENKGLTIGLSSSFSVVSVLIILLVIFVSIPGEYYLVNGKDDDTVTSTEDDKISEEESVSGSLSFTANTYEVEANKDVDMSKYLQCEGLELEDVTWSADSDKMYVGSDGHVSLHDNGLECQLTAIAKADDTIKASCQLKTRTAAEDLTYQIEALNTTVHTQDEEIDNGVIRVAYDNEDSQSIDLSGRD